MTFSIVARCPETLALGVAVSTAVPAVGGVVPHARAVEELGRVYAVASRYFHIPE